MLTLWKLIPLLILTLYNIYRFLQEDTKKHWWKALCLLIVVPVVWILLQSFLSVIDPYLLTVTLLVLFSFEMLQIFNNKMSLSFHLLFLIVILMVTRIAHRYTELIVVMEYLMLLVYLLAESNQRYMKRSYEESAAEYQNKVLAKQVNEVQNIYMTMRGWRHDYHNHLQTLKAHLMFGQTKEASTYLGKLEQDLDQVNSLIETGNVNLDAILNSKLSLALKGNIDINYKASVPAELTVSDLDLCVLIGNLIDNAVEACEAMDVMESNRFIRLYIGILKQQLYITVTNTTKEVVRKLDEEYITTKRGNHGHGLKRINKIVEKYGGYINRKNEPGVFITEILLPL